MIDFNGSFKINLKLIQTYDFENLRITDRSWLSDITNCVQQKRYFLQNGSVGVNEE